MKLAQLLALYPELQWGQAADREITKITRDSREVDAKTVFVAVRGQTLDGHDLLVPVCGQNPAAVVVERTQSIPTDFTGAVVRVPDTRVALEKLASRFYGDPAEELFCVGVTGTNGKTSTTYMVEEVLTRFGWRTGVMGTINHHLGDHLWETGLTTPDSITLHKRLSEFRSLGAAAAVFEVSSHALDQHRVDNIPFDVAVFTNLTRDHLDYHGSMEKYFSAKQKLFSNLLASSRKPNVSAIVNSDDDWGQRVQVAERARVWTYGRKSADFQIAIQQADFSGTKFLLKTPRGEEKFQIRLPGLHNVYNATAAVAVGLAAGASIETCQQALWEFRGVPGRLQRVPSASDLNVFVDYAHTDDALRVVLESLADVRQSAQSTSRIITVFGCGGDRDPGKRPLMANVAARLSDLVFITSDNPRSEDPEKIIADCVAGLDPQKLGRSVYTEVDRKVAIGRALQSAHPGDVILIAGKGHEQFQIIGTERRPFNDAQVVTDWLNQLGK